MRIDIYFHDADDIGGSLAAIKSSLHALILQGKRVMATTAEILAKVATLEDAQAAMAAEVTEAVAELGELKTLLDAAIAAGGNAADLQAIADRLDAVTASLTATTSALDTADTANDPTP